MILTAYHEVQDYDKLAQLTASMRAHGWQGMPLVVISDAPNDFWCGALLTGSHRIKAARAAGLEQSEIPTIALSDVFAEAGLDYEAMCEVYQPETDAQYRAMAESELPAMIRDQYGIEG